MELSVARLHRAEETSHRRRIKVAEWKDMPVAPPPTGLEVVVRELLGDRLDTAAVLTELHRLEVRHQLASGSKFAAFSQVDGLLGLDLCGLVGKLRR
ncbi:hypothetical protein [Luteimicrobium album]|uniref:hypothetical protein n=1 Tax=Luteimicrobium album TaxID=1054550 RepID=UPI0024E0E79F|nr:hypothetical protein [Luteimicrobium album]